MKYLINSKNDELYFENQSQYKKIEKTGKNRKNSVKRSNLLSRNEIQISKVIREIPCFFLNFGPILHYRDFVLAEIDDEKFEKCKIMNESNNTYFLFQYANQEKMQDFWSFFDKSATKKQKILKIILVFKNLLQLLKKLDNRNLVNMNVVPNNILFKEDDTPYLINFDQTLLLEKDQDERKSNEMENLLFSEYNPRKIHLPLEVHLICYMNSKNLVSLSAANIETVLNDWLGSVSLSPFGKYISEELKATTLFSRRGLINKPKYWIKQELMKFFSTWNNYSLSILFLHLLSSLDIKETNHKFINGFISILLKNISATESKRESVDKTLEVFEELIYSNTQEEWQQLFQ